MAIASFYAGEDITAGDAVFVDSNGILFKGIGTDKANASVVGFAIDSVSSGNLTRVDVDAQCTSLSSLTPGVDYFLSLTTSGQIYDYTNWDSDLSLVSASGAFLTRVGKASATTTLNIEIASPIYVIK